MRGYSCKATKWVDFVMTDSTRRESCHFSKIIRLPDRVKGELWRKEGGLRTFTGSNRTIKKRKLWKNSANFKHSKFVPSATTFSPQTVQPGHTKTPHLHHKFCKTPLKNTKTPRRKICKITTCKSTVRAHKSSPEANDHAAPERAPHDPSPRASTPSGQPPAIG